MIKTETISPKALRLTAPEKFRSDDFQKLPLQVDPLIRQHNNIRLLIDASKFHGWEKISALKNHVVRQNGRYYGPRFTISLKRST